MARGGPEVFWIGDDGDDDDCKATAGPAGLEPDRIWSPPALPPFPGAYAPAGISRVSDVDESMRAKIHSVIVRSYNEGIRDIHRLALTGLEAVEDGIHSEESLNYWRDAIYAKLDEASILWGISREARGEAEPEIEDCESSDEHLSGYDGLTAE